MGYENVVATHPVLQRLNPEQVSVLCGHSRMVRYPRSQFIDREELSRAELHLVVDGYVRLSKSFADGRELIVGLAGPNDLFGICCQPAWPGTAHCSARAQTRARLVTISGHQWTGLMADRPDIAHVVLQALMMSREQCTALSSDLAFLDLEARLAKLLFRLSRWSRPDPEGMLAVPRLFSQAELASALGSTRVPVTRKIGSLVASGALARSGRTILIADLAKLKSYFQAPAGAMA